MKAWSRHNYSRYILSLFNISPVAIFVINAIFFNNTLAAEKDAVVDDIASNVDFDPSFLKLSKQDSIDLSLFRKGAAALPGKYQVTLVVNDTEIGSDTIDIKERADKSTYPCLTSALITTINFNYDQLPKNINKLLQTPQQCLDLETHFPQVHFNFDSSEQKLYISVPQMYINQSPHGYVSPALWDRGVMAGLLSYNVNSYSSRSNGQDYNSVYAGIAGGLNIGAWYFRHNGSYNWTNNGVKTYTSINSYVQRDLPPLKARMLLGQSNTTGDVFDTLPFTGVQIATDDRMLPDSLRGYAPVIHGVARTNARVIIKQGEQVIYQTTVSPGAFSITDLYPTGYGGDLDVTVNEADGSVQTFSVPYASVAQLLRPGFQRYSVTAGELRNSALSTHPRLFQGTYQRGLSNLLTGYGGVQANENYYAAQLGVALGTEIGAFAFDVTQANTDLGGDYGQSDGQSYHVSYSKLISETNSNFSLAANRFSTSGFMDFTTAMQARNAISNGDSINNILRTKDRLTLSATQGLPDSWGQFYISSSIQNYWNKEGSDKQYQFGYNNYYKSLTYGININRSQNEKGSLENTYTLNISFPLGTDSKASTPQMRFDVDRNNNGQYGERVSVNGTNGIENQYSWGATATRDQTGGSSGSLSGQYRGSKASVATTVSAGDHYQSGSLGINGTIVAHPGGVTLTPYSSDTFAIVEAKGAEGASVSSYPGIKVDSQGYAAVPYLNPYELNEIYIDPKNAASDVEFDNTSQKVAPYLGAVVMVKYSARQGIPVLISTSFNGQPIPFGSNVQDDDGNVIGATGQGGEIYARVNGNKGRLHVLWGVNEEYQCGFDYALPSVEQSHGKQKLQRYKAICEAERKAVKPSSDTLVISKK